MKIRLDQIKKSYGDETVFSGLTADIPAGTLLTVLGVNGAGKTTLLRMLASVAGRNGGDILFDGQSAERDNLEQRRKLSFMPDFPLFFEEKTILENICAQLKIWQRPQPDHDVILDLLEEFNLLKHAAKPAQTLSRGQRYKAAFISMILIDPELWMLDEPFASGMDPQGISSFKRYSLDAIQRGRTIIYTTQLVELARSFSNRIWILHEGGILADGSSDNIDWNQETLLSIF